MIIAAACQSIPAPAQQQAADADFDARVARPAYPDGGPTVAIDRAHNNFHTSDGRYAPFAQLLRNDGFVVADGTQPFSATTLASARVLVIANALSPQEDRPEAEAFTDAEGDAVHDWVRRGGALLLIADHAPFGSAAQRLAARFGVDMGQGWVVDAAERGFAAILTYSRTNGRLGDHPITRGRNADEAIGTITAFAGQSLSLPEGATALMTLSPAAREAPDVEGLQAAAQAMSAGLAPGAQADHSRAVGGRVQGLAMRVGAGRVVVLGEAAMLSAQVITREDGEVVQRFGMNVPGTDNRQFALNLVRWLAGALD